MENRNGLRPLVPILALALLPAACGDDGADGIDATGYRSEGESTIDDPFAGCSSAPRTVDTLDFFLADDPSKVIVAEVYDPATGRTHRHPLSQPHGADHLYFIKWGQPDRHELYTWDASYIYLRYDNTWGEGPGGAASYEFRDVPGKGGRWMKRSMAVGERIVVDQRHGQRNFWPDCSTHSEPDLRYKNRLLYHCADYELGALGSDEVIVLEYRYWDDSGYELFFFSRRWGWVRWMQWRRGGSGYYIDGDVFRREVEMCGAKPCQALAPAPACVMPPAPVSDAAFVRQSVPTSVAPGAAFTASVTMRNAGSSRWTRSAGFNLGSQGPADNLTWGAGRIQIPDGVVVEPGATLAFSHRFVAPAAAGSYVFQWRMLQEGVEWFGASSARVTIAVGGGGDPDPDPDPDPVPDPTSSEEIIVSHAFAGILGRAPDPGGLAFWAGKLATGTSVLQMCRAMFASTEFAANRADLSPEELVDELYLGILERPADPGGRANAAAEVRAGRRAEVATSLLESGEFVRRFLE